jgi:hypothetical protein
VLRRESTIQATLTSCSPIQIHYPAQHLWRNNWGLSVVGYLKPCYPVQIGLERGQRCILGAFRNLKVQVWELHFTLNLTQTQECGEEGTPTIGWGFVLLVINSLLLL